jgi:exodeoxyribonuclease-3
MKIATWNVNSIRVRLPQVLEWLKQENPDVLCLQETKITDADFPAAALRDAGYQSVYAGQKTYNGVATLSRAPATDVVSSLPGAAGDQKRLLAATMGGVRVVNVYVPNGEEVGSDKYSYKLSWLKALEKFIARELKSHPRLALLGDYNIAPEERDVHDPKRWEGRVLFSDKERAAFQRLARNGLTDVFRNFDQPEKSFSWWDYRAGAFQRNHGLRIDHILCSDTLASECRHCRIDIGPRKHERPSDHAPVIAEFTDTP